MWLLVASAGAQAATLAKRRILGLVRVILGLLGQQLALLVLGMVAGLGFDCAAKFERRVQTERVIKKWPYIIQSDKKVAPKCFKICRKKLMFRRYWPLDISARAGIGHPC